MKVRNRLKQMLEERGIRQVIPTDDLLQNRLGGMTLRRFNKILANSSERELTLTEARNLTRWIAELTNQPEAAIRLMDEATEEAAV